MAIVDKNKIKDDAAMLARLEGRIDALCPQLQAARQCADDALRAFTTDIDRAGAAGAVWCEDRLAVGWRSDAGDHGDG